MALTLKKHIVLLALIVLFTFTFTTVEVLISPEDNTANAQRKRKKKQKTVKQEKSTEQASELEQALGEGQDSSLIPLSQLIVDPKVDTVLTSPVGIKIDEAIVKLLKILSRFQEPGTLRRLAEFYWKKANRLNLDLMQEHQRKMDIWFEAGQKGKPPVVPDESTWFVHHRIAVDICQIVMDRYPDFSGMDEVYFFMGYNLVSIGREADANDYYKKLVREFPNSPKVPDAWMAIGDYYFSHNNVYDALPAYEEVLRYEASKVFGYAKYKIGWCYYNLGKYKKAIVVFKEVVAWSIDQEKIGKQQITLKEEALKDLVRAFAEEGSVDEAEKYFLTVGGKKFFRMMLVMLADIYTNQGKFTESIKVFKRLIHEYPNHIENSEFQLKVVEAYVNLNDKKNTTKEIIDMVYYAKPADESAWVKANIENDPELVHEAWENAERMIIKTVVEYHKEALKINNAKTWDMAQGLYEICLQYFKKSDKHYDIMFNYSELLYRRKMYKQAGEWYTKVAESDPKGKKFEEASYSAILSYEKLVHKEINAWIGDTKSRSRRGDKSYKLATTDKQKAKEQAQREKFTRRPLSENVQGFVKACNIYIDNIPKSKFKVDIIYKVAIIYYAHNHFDEGVGRFELIIKDYPSHRLSKYAANLILDSLNIAQRWRKLNSTARAYLKNGRLIRAAGKAFKRDLIVLLEKSTFKKIEMTEKEENWVGASEEYLAFVKEFPRSVVCDKAIYNASVHYVKAGMLEKSIETQLLFLKKYKKSAAYSDVLFKLGKNYEALAYYNKAAERYDQYVAKYPKGEFYMIALFNAGVFYTNLGDTKKGVKLKRKYIEKTKKADEKNQLFLGIAFTYMDAKDYKNAEKQFKAYLVKREKDITWPRFDKDSGKIKKRGKIKNDAKTIFISHIQLIQIYQKQERKNDVDKHYKTVLKLAECDAESGVGEAGREIIAEASFFKLQTAFDTYTSTKMEVRNRRLKKDKWNEAIATRMKDMLKMMADLQKAYEGVIALKSPRWTVASLYMFGQSLLHYSKSIANSEIPYWLDQDQRVFYIDGLQEKIDKIELKAMIYFYKTLVTAYKTGVYSNYTNLSREELEGYQLPYYMTNVNLGSYIPTDYKPISAIKYEPGMESDSVYSAKYNTPEVPNYTPVRAVPAAGTGDAPAAAGSEG